MEHHWGERRSTNVTVQIFTRPATVGIGRVINVSSTGAFMETQLPLRLLSLLYLQPTDLSPADGVSGRIAATVVRFGATGVGLEWCEFAAETTQVYARLAAESTDPVDAPQLPLPAMPEALLPRGPSRSLELAGLCRLELAG
jgi:hypothetical protein